MKGVHLHDDIKARVPVGEAEVLISHRGSDVYYRSESTAPLALTDEAIDMLGQHVTQLGGVVRHRGDHPSGGIVWLTHAFPPRLRSHRDGLSPVDILVMGWEEVARTLSPATAQASA